MRTDHAHGYVVERGPNTLQLKPPMHAALVERGLDEALVKASPASRRRYLLRGGALEPVPTSPWGFVRTPLLSPGGKLRLLAEPFLWRREIEGESVAEFMARRFGRQVAERLVGPFLTGVYAGDENSLGAAAVFPNLVDHEHRVGSVVLGALSRSRGPRAPAGSWSSREGLGVFARRVAERLSAPPALGARVAGLHRGAGGWQVDVESAAGSSQLEAERVVLAVSAPEAARLLAPIDSRCAELLSGIAYAPVVGMPLGVARADLARAPDGFGFLVPRDEPASLLGCLFMSQLFADRAPADHELLHCMLGGTRWPEAVELADDQLLLGATRWQQAIPQPGRDHVARIVEVRARLASHAGLALAGSYLDGVAVADAFGSGLRAARELASPV